MLALADQIFVEITDRFAPCGDWAADLCQLALLGREVSRRNAVTLAWLGYRNTGRSGDQAVALATLRLPLDAGLTQEQALFHYGVYTDTVMGLLTADAMRESLDEDALFATQIDLHIQAIRATATGTPAIASADA
ncbi:hypothetical protein [Streptomyces acidicola]|uniref:hypothetical protein n=1 Tax=Streptomyces acidicola TaxID=2596892 RepID=UPI003817DA91